MSKDKPSKYAPENTAPDGSYITGKAKPPESGKFRKGDGRKRGRREKGTRNFATDFNEEMAAAVTMTVNGKSKKVSRQRSIIMRVADNASRGVPSAVKTVFELRQKIADPTQKSGASEVETEPAPDLSRLDDHELEVFGRLLAKVQGTEFEQIEPTIPDGPLAYRFLPPSIDRSHIRSTVEGVLTRHYHCRGDPFEILSVGNRAYYSAALPRKYGRDRDWLPCEEVEANDGNL